MRSKLRQHVERLIYDEIQRHDALKSLSKESAVSVKINPAGRRRGEHSSTGRRPIKNKSRRKAGLFFCGVPLVCGLHSSAASLLVTPGLDVQPVVGAEHIFLGLLREGSGVAAVVLKTLGVDIRTARDEVHRELGAGNRGE